MRLRRGKDSRQEKDLPLGWAMRLLPDWVKPLGWVKPLRQGWAMHRERG